MKVVVPVATTSDPQALIDVLIGMRWHTGIEIKLMTVVPHWVEFSAAQVTIPASLREMEALAVELRKALRICDISFDTREGDAKVEIVDFAQEVAADLILMGASCKSGLEEIVTGSVSHYVLAHSHCPVLIARPVYDAVSDPQSGFVRVLVPVDDSVYADAAMQWLINFRWNRETRFTLASVIEHENASPVAVESLVKRMQLFSAVLGNDIEYEVLRGDPTDTIIRLAFKHAADLIVIGSHARTGLHKLLLGSVSEALAHRAPCSIAVIRGIVAKDDSWRRTGVFTGPKVAQPAYAAARTEEYSGNPSSFHVPPGGMH